MKGKLFFFLHLWKSAFAFSVLFRKLCKNVVFDQGNINSCSANSVSNQIKLSCDNLPCHVIPSRLYIYINSRMEDADENQQPCISDEGSSLKLI